jgi:hypothetical protein
MSKRAKPTAVVPPPPDGYNGTLPALPPRNTIVHVACHDPYASVPSGLQPASLTVVRQKDGTEHGVIVDQAVAELLLTEGRMRDELADAACIEILAAMQGEEMTPELCHGLRMRLRKLADDAHAITRVGMAEVSRRERSKKRSKHDPKETCRRVEAKVVSGMTVLDSLMEVGEETDQPISTVRRHYYDNRPKK